MGNLVPSRRVRLGLLSEDEVAARSKRSVEEFVRVAQEGDLERVNAALSEGIHPNSKTRAGLSPLVVAAQAGHDHIIRNVLRAPIPDVDIDVTDLSGWTPLHYAVKTSRMSTIRILVQNGANLRARAQHGVTPLMVACSVGELQVITFLVSQIPDSLNDADAFGQTALMTACDRGHDRVVQQLLDLGADARRRDLQGSSALHYAAASGMIRAVKMLIKAGAEPTRVDMFGNSALDSAIAQEQFGTLALLRHIVSTQEWWANAKGGTGSAATTAGGFGGIHVLRQVLETGAESQWRGEESRGRARLV